MNVSSSSLLTHQYSVVVLATGVTAATCIAGEDGAGAKGGVPRAQIS
jgi:hypothetical protein